MDLKAPMNSQCLEVPPTQSPKKHFVKTLAQSTTVTSMLCGKIFVSKAYDDYAASDSENSVPIVDYSLLTSADPQQRSKTIQDLGKACREWSNFMLINHTVPEKLMKDIMDACLEFCELPEEQKWKYGGIDPLAPIVCGTSADGAAEEGNRIFIWRDFLKFMLSPELHTPIKPDRFREIALEYKNRTREVARELFKGIAESLGVEENYIEKNMNMESGYRILGVNYYPPCPQPEKAVGLPHHSDPGFFTLLTQNEVGGLQVQHNGNWVNVNVIPNSFIVNLADNLEIFTNGKYKSSVHRALVTNKATRITIAVSNGPPSETVVSPAPEFIDADNPPAYTSITYKEFMQLQFSGGAKLAGKTPLEYIFTNGKYKSSVHRALVTNKATRITIAVSNGPPSETVVSPAPEFIDADNPPAYTSITYKEFMQLQFSGGAKLAGKTPLEYVRI